MYYTVPQIKQAKNTNMFISSKFFTTGVRSSNPPKRLNSFILYKLSFLLNDSIKQNSNVNPTSDELKNLIQKIAALHETGIHPSYYSLEENTIQSEIKLLKSITKTAVSKSRQHFIKISFPTYFNALLSAGIQIDFSLCYPERSGFRAGCSQPFYFFDVEKNETTTLLLQPSCFMDATFEYYEDDLSDTVIVDGLGSPFRKC